MTDRNRCATVAREATQPLCVSVGLSVIVPFAPGEREGEVLLEQLDALGADSEVILVRAVDADTATVPDRPVRSCRLECRSRPGRARQMNLGARMARGHWLWFLHADSRLCSDTLEALHAFMACDEAMGWFDLRYRNDGPRLTRLNALGANLRSRWLGMPFGDQGLIIPSKWFGRLGGYDEKASCGEDHLLVWRAHAAGLPVRRIGACLSSSARKYAEQGWWRTTTRHAYLTARQAWPEWKRLRRRGTR